MEKFRFLMLCMSFATAIVFSCSKDKGGDPAGEPSIDFSYSPEEPTMSTPIQFSAIVNPGSSNIVSWKWSFGNSTGTTSTEKDPTFTYNQQGTFQVQLEGTDAAGKTAKATKTVTVEADPVSVFPAELVWTLENPAEVATMNDASRPVIDDDGIIYYIVGGISSAVSRLVAVTDAGTSAQVKWQWDPGLGLRAGPSIGPDGNLHQTSWSVESIGKINASTGSVMWGHPTNSGSSNSTPAVDGSGNIFAATRITASVGGVYSFDVDGNLRWSILAPNVPVTYSSPAISKNGNTVYFYHTGPGTLAAYNAADGSPKWAAPVGGDGTGHGTSVSIDADGTIYATNDSEVIAVIDNGDSGALKWKSGGLIGPNNSGVVIGPNGDLYVGTKEGLKALNAATGAVKWTYPSWIDECVPAVDKHGNVYFGNDAGKLVIVNAEGELEAEITVGGPAAVVHSPVIGDNGNVYVEVAEEGKIRLCKIAVEDGGPANSAWPMKGQNRKHTSQAK